MKKEIRNFDNLILKSKAAQRKVAKIVVIIALIVLTMATVTGCGKKKSKPTPGNKVESTTTNETTPDIVETSVTPTTVEDTEVAPTETEVIEDISTIDLSQYANAMECVNDLKNYNTFMIIVYGDNGAEKILVDGDSYGYCENDSYFINRSPQNSEIENAYIKSSTGEYKLDSTDDVYLMPFRLSMDSYTIVLEYNDGTKEEMTITLE